MNPYSRFALAFLFLTPLIPTALAQSGIITNTVVPPGSASLSLNTSAGGSTVSSTVGSNESTQTGFAKVAIYSGATPYGTAVFSLKQNGVTVSEVGVPASPPTTSARVFIDFRSSVNAIPARSEAGAIDINTGIAVANLSGYFSAQITYTLRNVSGATISVGHGTLDARAHFAKFIHQLKEVASDFLLPKDFQTSTKFASLEISSDQSLSIAALRLTNNQRNDPLFTTTPVADLTQPLTNDVIYFPQLVDGGGYTTSIVLLNTSSTTETGTLHFIDDNGNPLTANWVGGTADSSLRYTIPAGGSARFQTEGFPAASKIGWAELIPDAGTSTPIGAGVFSYNPGNILYFESGVPATLPTNHARVYVDLSGGHSTGLAIANAADSNVEITMKAFQSDGVSEIGTSNGVLQLPAKGHRARFAHEFISGLPAGFTGVLDVSSPTPIAALTLRSLNNERNDFLATLVPVADMTRNAPAPIVFPQIADGGGYVTQFILIGAGGASNATLYFHDNEGKPLAVGSGGDTPPPGGAVYYLDCSAQTAGSGTQESPWNSLDAANALVFRPGDTLLLKRGMTCSGMLTPHGSGTSGSPIIIDAYGSGSRPIIDGGMNTAAIGLWDIQYWEVNNLEIVGGDIWGISVRANIDNSVLNHIYLKNLDVHGTHKHPLVHWDCASSKYSFCSDALIDGVVAHDNPVSEEGVGIIAGGFTNITVQNSTVHDVPDTGILLIQVKDSMIQNCLVYNTGMSAETPYGSVGIAYVSCENCVMQFNESYSNRGTVPTTPGFYPGWDGGGFDMSARKNGLFQYNYGHDNWGYCVTLGAPNVTPANIVIRYNVCSNNGQKSPYSQQGEFFMHAYDPYPADGVEIYNNTFSWNPVGTGPAIFLYATYTGANPNFFKNNIIYSAVPEMIRVVPATSGMTFDNNIYWTTSGNTPTWEMDGTSYAGLSAFQRGTGQDSHSFYADPMMLNPTYHDIGKPTTAFTLQPGSPAIGHGANVCSGISTCATGNRDFWGNLLPIGGGFSIGAYQPPPK